jgi:hypothetical protein
VQRVVDLDGEMPRRLFLRQLGLAAEHFQRRCGVVGALRLPAAPVAACTAPAARSRLQLVELGRRSASSAAAKHFCARASYSASTSSCVIRPDSSAIAPSATADRRLHRTQLLDRAPLDLEVGAGVAHDACGLQVQEGRRRVRRQCSTARLDIAVAAARSRPSAKK